MHVFRHPKYYEEFRQRAKRYQKELRERNKSDQAISDEASTEATSVRPGPGQTSKQQAPSTKPQATQTQKETNCSSDKNPEQQASSRKLQALRCKRQASSRKRQAP